MYLIERYYGYKASGLAFSWSDAAQTLSSPVDQDQFVCQRHVTVHPNPATTSSARAYY
jgi:hypothetical protein